MENPLSSVYIVLGSKKEVKIQVGFEQLSRHGLNCWLLQVWQGFSPVGKEGEHGNQTLLHYLHTSDIDYFGEEVVSCAPKEAKADYELNWLIAVN